MYLNIVIRIIMYKYLFDNPNIKGGKSYQIDKTGIGYLGNLKVIKSSTLISIGI